jgi:hypothetical protein
MENQIQIQATDPKQLDGLTPQQLVSQIREISEQYQREVPGQRRHWPESIRSRILALGRLGVPESKIGDLTGIPRATVFLWCRSLPRTASRKRGRPSAGKFVQVHESPTVKSSEVSPTVGQSDMAALVTPDGFRMEFTGADARGAIAQVYRELRNAP